MLHFCINTGIQNTSYYWNKLLKYLKIYIKIKKIDPNLNILNIGGGFPIKTSFVFKYDYEKMINEIIDQIKKICHEKKVSEPHIYTEFGTYTVGESGGILYKIIHQKKQNNKEKWYIINSSFMTTIPDIWAINKKFILMAINHWDHTYEKVFLGGLTCDRDDYYHSEEHKIKSIYLPTFRQDSPLYIGFFNIGSYQDTISGYGGVHHCLIPQPIHIIINKDSNNKLSYRVFRQAQSSEEVLKILGYL